LCGNIYLFKKMDPGNNKPLTENKIIKNKFHEILSSLIFTFCNSKSKTKYNILILKRNKIVMYMAQQVLVTGYQKVLAILFCVVHFPLNKLHWWPSELSAPSECGRSGVQTPIRSSQRLKNWHLLFPWLAFTI